MATDRFSWTIKCPKCGKGGEVKLSESDGWSFVKGSRDRHVDSVPEGFVVVDHGREHGQKQ